MVSSRWIQFSAEGSTKLSEGEAISLWVMTEGVDGEPRKLCELIVTREDLMSAIELIEKTLD